MFSFSDLLNFYSLFYYRQSQETYSCLFTHNRTRSRTHTQTHALSYHKLCCSIVPRYWTIQHNHTHAHSHTQCRSCFFLLRFHSKLLTGLATIYGFKTAFPTIVLIHFAALQNIFFCYKPQYSSLCTVYLYNETTSHLIFFSSISHVITTIHFNPLDNIQLACHSKTISSASKHIS